MLRPLAFPSPTIFARGAHGVWCARMIVPCVLARVSVMGGCSHKRHEISPAYSVKRGREKFKSQRNWRRSKKDLLSSWGKNLASLAEMFPCIPDSIDAAMRSVDDPLRVEITRHSHQHFIGTSIGKSPAGSTVSRVLFHIEGMAATICEMRYAARLITCSTSQGSWDTDSRAEKRSHDSGNTLSVLIPGSHYTRCPVFLPWH